MTTNNIIPNRGEVWWINFNPSIGGEIKKTRPAIIVSNDIANKVLNRVQVIPLTSNINKIYPAECIVNIKANKNKAMADQLATISKLRLVSKLTTISPQDMSSVERVILLQLGFRD